MTRLNSVYQVRVLDFTSIDMDEMDPEVLDEMLEHIDDETPVRLNVLLEDYDDTDPVIRAVEQVTSE